jgi:hypothetical protein
LPIGLNSEDILFAGPYASSLFDSIGIFAHMKLYDSPMDDEYARGLAMGDIDPISKLPMIDINPGAFPPHVVRYLLLPNCSPTIMMIGDTD